MLLIATFVYSFTYKPSPQLLKFIIQKGGGLRVDGSTNINTFACEISDYANGDTLTIAKNIKTSAVQMNGTLTVNISDFNCHNAIMTSDLRKTLKMKEYPTMIIRFISINKFPELNNTSEQETGIAEIELAGVTKRFDVNYTFSIDENKNVHLQGTKSVKFTDFNLIPPRKLGGMIQAKDNLDVLFYLNLKLVK